MEGQGHIFFRMVKEGLQLINLCHSAVLFTVGETGAHWDTGYSGTSHILEILRKKMPL